MVWSQVNRVKRDAAQVLSFKIWTRKHNDTSSVAVMLAVTFTANHTHIQVCLFITWLSHRELEEGWWLSCRLWCCQSCDHMLSLPFGIWRCVTSGCFWWGTTAFQQENWGQFPAVFPCSDQSWICLRGKPSFWQQNWVFFKGASGHFWSFLWQLKTGISNQDIFLCINLNRETGDLNLNKLKAVT